MAQSRTLTLAICVAWIVAWWSLYFALGPQIKAYALAQMGSTADYFFTYLGPELLLLAFGLVVVPLFYLLLLHRLPWWLQALSVPSLIIACAVAVFYDVYKIAREAEHLCTTEAGLKVYRTVEAEGMLGLSDVQYWAARGLKYVERTNSEGEFVRETLAGADVTTEKSAVAMSEFRFAISRAFLDIAPIERNVASVASLKSGEIVGTVTYFHIFRGWADEVIDVGLNFSPPRCWTGVPESRGGEKYTLPTDLVLATIKTRNPGRK